MHRLDHPALVALGAAGRRRDQPAGRVELLLARAEQRGWRSRSGSDGSPTCRRSPRRGPAAHSAASPSIGLEPVVDAVEGGDAGGAGGEHDPLQRVDQARPACRRPAGRGRRRDRWCRRSGRASPARSRPRRSPRAASRSSPAPACAISQPASCTCLRALGLGEDDEIGARRGGPRRRRRHNAGCRVGLTRIATGRPPKPSCVAATAASRAAALSSSRHRILEVEDRSCRRRACAPSRSRADWTPGRNSSERQRRRSVWSIASDSSWNEAPFVYMISRASGGESRHGHRSFWSSWSSWSCSTCSPV